MYYSEPDTFLYVRARQHFRASVPPVELTFGGLRTTPCGIVSRKTLLRCHQSAKIPVTVAPRRDCVIHVSPQSRMSLWRPQSTDSGVRHKGFASRKFQRGEFAAAIEVLEDDEDKDSSSAGEASLAFEMVLTAGKDTTFSAASEPPRNEGSNDGVSGKTLAQSTVTMISGLHRPRILPQHSSRRGGNERRR